MKFTVFEKIVCSDKEKDRCVLLCHLSLQSIVALALLEVWSYRQQQQLECYALRGKAS